jgi:hypothetical protein
MRRLAVWIAIGLAATETRAQSGPVSLSMTLDTVAQRTGAKWPVVYLQNLLHDQRWYEALDNALPIVVSYDLKLWRSREGWIDEFLTTFTWETIVTKEPLQEEYSVALVVNNVVRPPRRFAERDSANSHLNLPQRIEVYPPRPGRFYYTLDARITALSDREIDRLERFLAGDPEPDVPDRGTVVGRGIRRFLLKLAGLPSQILTSRTDQFDVRPNED